VDAAEIQERLLSEFGLRVGLETSRYVLGRLDAAGGPIPVMGADARTGVARTVLVQPSSLQVQQPPR
jgi:hypothetical protein